MKLLFSAYGLRYPLTGIGWYIYHLMGGLKKHNFIKKLIITPEYGCEEVNSKINSVQLTIKKIIQFLPGSYDFLHAYNSYKFFKKNRFLSSEQFIYHEPCYILRPYPGIKVCTVHDLSHIHHPDSHPKKRVKFLSYYLPSSIETADHIITGSYSVRNEIINQFKLDPKKITVIYHGVSAEFHARQHIEVNSVLRRYGLLGKTYILSLGTLEPRKNLLRLIQAFKSLSELQRKNFPLVLVGLPGWNMGELKKLLKQMANKEELFCLGYVATNDLPYLYAGAYAFVYLSLYEGFGLPLLEALASGTPTLTSNISSMPEVVGNAAVMVNPYDVNLIGEKLKQLLNDNLLREQLKYSGPIRAALFSWKKCVDNTVKVYQQLLGCSS